MAKLYGWNNDCDNNQYCSISNNSINYTLATLKILTKIWQFSYFLWAKNMIQMKEVS